MRYLKYWDTLTELKKTKKGIELLIVRVTYHIYIVYMTLVFSIDRNIQTYILRILVLDDNVNA